ncbi:hypothetical protein SPFM20_00044 [Salmonella phage SPFM20]|nr:hypothetical protein SPFM20_00044 [Salmonella phage SPFM20]
MPFAVEDAIPGNPSDAESQLEWVKVELEVERFELTSIKDVESQAGFEDLVNELRDSTTFGQGAKHWDIDLFFKLAGHPVIDGNLAHLVRRIKLEPGELAEDGRIEENSDIGFASGLTFYERRVRLSTDKTAVLTLKRQASLFGQTGETFLDVIMPVVNGKTEKEREYCMWVKPTEEGWQWKNLDEQQEKEVITVARESISLIEPNF